LISSVAIQQLAVNFSPNINATTVNISMIAGVNSPFGVRQDVRITLANPKAHTGGVSYLSPPTLPLVQIKEMSLYAEVLHGGSVIGGLTVPMTVREPGSLATPPNSYLLYAGSQPIEDQSGNLTIALTLAPLRVVNATCFSLYGLPVPIVSLHSFVRS
jgi:hypothetical protein